MDNYSHEPHGQVQWKRTKCGSSGKEPPSPELPLGRLASASLHTPILSHNEGGSFKRRLKKLKETQGHSSPRRERRQVFSDRFVGIFSSVDKDFTDLTTAAVTDLNATTLGSVGLANTQCSLAVNPAADTNLSSPYGSKHTHTNQQNTIKPHGHSGLFA